MPRPFKCRRVRCRPGSDYFKPRGIPIDLLEEVTLTMDELEAVRLADLDGKYQEDAAKKMNVSRQTFGNILSSAHKKIADCLVNSKALNIEGGVIKMMEKQFTCHECKNEWTLPYGSGRPNECPKCKSKNIHRAAQDRGFAAPAGGQARGRGGQGRGFGGGNRWGQCRRTA
ncbi:DUF134 domain-containing protein [Candidatus Margulisiibacteriota bacterium]